MSATIRQPPPRNAKRIRQRRQYIASRRPLPTGLDSPNRLGADARQGGEVAEGVLALGAGTAKAIGLGGPEVWPGERFRAFELGARHGTHCSPVC